MEEFLNALKDYELLLELILTAASLFISVFVVIQTKNLAKRQAKQDLELAERQAKQEREIADRQNELQKWQTRQEREIAEQQNELQKRQIRLELFEWKFKTKVALKQIFDISHVVLMLERDTVETDFLNSEDDVLWYIDNRIKEIDKTEFGEIFSRSKYIFEQSLYSDIDFVHFWFDSVCDALNIMRLEKENGIPEHYEKIKELIFSNLKKIYENKTEIMQQIEKELDISKIDK